MIVLGLTGSIGMGKSTTLGLFAEVGVPTHSADAAVHDLYENEAVPLIEAAFPGTAIGGRVDREKLSRAVLGKPEALKRLEAIVHPLVRQKEMDFIAHARASGAPLAVVDIPLLYETGGEERVSKVLVVTAPPDTQRKRVMARPGMTAEKFEAILARQMPDAQKRARADFVIDSSLGMDNARSAVRSIIRALSESESDA